MENITLIADSKLIEKARLKAQQESPHSINVLENGFSPIQDKKKQNPVQGTYEISPTCRVKKIIYKRRNE